jgi:hypothetical protein
MESSIHLIAKVIDYCSTIINVCHNNTNAFIQRTGLDNPVSAKDWSK